MTDNLLTVKQAAFVIKVHPLTIRRYIREKRLKAVKAGGNVRIREANLNEFQSEFSPEPKKRLFRPIVKPTTPFSFDDALWRINGRISVIG